MSEEAHEKFHADPLPLTDWGSSLEFTFTNGGVCKMGDGLPKDIPGIAKIRSHIDGFYGWFGMGGSIF